MGSPYICILDKYGTESLSSIGFFHTMKIIQISNKKKKKKNKTQTKQKGKNKINIKHLETKINKKN